MGPKRTAGPLASVDAKKQKSSASKSKPVPLASDPSLERDNTEAATPPTPTVSDLSEDDNKIGTEPLALTSRDAENAEDLSKNAAAGDETNPNISGPDLNVNRDVIHDTICAAITENTRYWFDGGVSDRLRTLLGYEKREAGIFSIARLPDLLPGSVQWGRGGADKSHLFYKDNLEPLSLWITGQVKATYFYGNNGIPFDTAAIYVEPLLTPDLAKVRSLTATLSRPTKQDSTANSLFQSSVRTSRYMRSFVRGSRTAVANEFTSVYDATTKLKSKDKMAKITPEDIRKNDSVMVEVRVRRIANKETKDTDGPGGGESSGEWQRWQVFLELQSINLIVRAPDDVVDDTGSVPSDDLDI